MCTLRKPGGALFGLAALPLLLSTGCATKKYVQQNAIAPLEAKINGVDKKYDEKTTENTNQIRDLDQKTERGIADAAAKADAANQLASKADKGAQDAQALAQKGVDGANQAQQEIQNIDNYQPVKNETVLFGFNKSTLSKDEQQKLDALAQSVVQMKRYVVEVKGYTDKIGAPSYNMALSQKRADEVVRYLAGQNVALVRIHNLGFGENEVSADTKREANKMSRRVEIRVLAPQLTAQTQTASSGTATQTQ